MADVSNEQTTVTTRKSQLMGFSARGLKGQGGDPQVNDQQLTMEIHHFYWEMSL